MTDDSHNETDDVERLADSFIARLRRGESPSADEYIESYPHFAEQLRDLLPAIALLERHAAANGSPSDSSSRAAPRIPEQIGDFIVIREIGRGGMGIVYEAVQQSLDRHVALKVMSAPSHLTDKYLERFRFEARAAARLQHSHIVPVFGVGEWEGLHFYAMQFIDGHSLHELLCTSRASGNVETTNSAPGARSKGTFDLSSHAFHTRYVALLVGGGQEFYRETARIGLEAAEALAYAHSENVLHRDIKPSNLMIDEKGGVWVTDFGLAKLEGVEGLTETGDFMGTLRYMAPERLEGALDRRSDIYSLGATLYELLTRQVFFGSSTHARLIEQILHESPPAPSQLRKDLPRDLETIVLKAVAKEPAARYRTADEMAQDLRLFLADRPILSRRPTASEKLIRWCQRNPFVAILSGSVAALLVVAILILTWSNARIRSESTAKDQAMASARTAVQDLLTRVASEKLSEVRMSNPLRAGLLEDAVKAYDGLLALGDSNIVIRQQMADALHKIAGLKRELERDTEAEDALRRSASLYASLAETDPNPPSIREAGAMVASDLAYTWQFDTHSPDRSSFPVEAQYRKALAMYEDIEHGWPARRQPVTQCLRYLADLSNRRGQKQQAEQFWRDAISRGEAYLKQNPANTQVQNEVCRACLEYYEGILSKSLERNVEAQAVLATGVKHAEEMQRQNPSSNEIANLLAAFHIRQALAASSAGNFDEAEATFRRAINEIHNLCISAPWNTDYWNSARWFHEVSIHTLQQANRQRDVDRLVEEIGDWLHRLTRGTAHDKSRQPKLLDTGAAFADVLHSIGRDREAGEFSTPAKRAAKDQPASTSRQ